MKLRRFKVSDIIIGLVLAMVVIGLLVALLRQLGLKHEVNGAKTVSAQIVSDIRGVKTSDARALATTTFQNNHSDQNLESLFKTINMYATGSTTVASQTVTNTKDVQNVGIVYQYSGAKQPYYIRIVTTKQKGSSKWQFAAISGGNDRSKLETNQN